MPNFTFLSFSAKTKKSPPTGVKAFSMFLLLFFSFSGALFAHTVDYFTTCPYFCIGSDVIVKAKVSTTNSATRYNWQYKDNANSWKCFKEGNNTINSVVFSVTGVKLSGTNNPPTLNIHNSTTVLNGVDIRLIMSDNADPCTVSPSSTNLWGDDKSQELHILNNCAEVATYCNSGTPLKLGNFVWNDLNGNNVKDANEPIVAGATVKLYRDSDNSNTPDSNTPLNQTTTNSTGLYYFENLAPGKYIVGVIIPAGYTRGAPSSIDPDNNVDNDNNGTTLVGLPEAGGEVRTKAITLSAGDEPTNDGDGNNGNLTLDIALCPASVVNNLKLGNLVWNDLNGNNVKDANEPIVAGATVKLYRDSDNSNTPDSNTP
ncbi:MAG: hypothetical protein JWQ96_1402, partial [Segetibacter sp.]|nr:hypothetical protein [Segetibacter sp.]